MIADKDKVLHSAGGKHCARPDCCVFLNGIYWHCLGLYIGEQKPPVGTGFVPQTSLTGVRKGVRKRVSGTARAEASSFGVRGQEDTAGGEGAGSAGVATLHFAGAAAALRGVPCGAEQRYERLRRRP